MTLEGMGTSLVVEGATTSAVFETYVERVLAPTLRPGQVVVMDNLNAHKGQRIKELIEDKGCELVYLPPYFTRFQSHRGSFLEDQGPPSQGRGSESGGTG